MLTFHRPDAPLFASYLDALRECHAEGRHLDLNPDELRAHPDAHLYALRARATPGRPDRIPETVFWAADAAGYAGRVSVRHTLNARLRRLDGHIGYEIRPARRGLGYGHALLAHGLQYARTLGLDRVLLTVRGDNAGSIRIIERGGGILETSRRLMEHDVPIRYYWIDLNAP
ncbi:GNAT family N-acetyltransferase [Deinococcus maricopensis]|uniref:GCN5-related N-acetyltransferase n=1 Tax=Deinococcus maricopensis (strain DSM 21211 / LMG 22137 / NRRL B-23946 / LB-34) TaxID=709986 RepID=E8U7V5_DEIML|nr:GNAT family N-acetyltransferase [Deinococcus maricopensis]ADV67144.1 GCN5-related N-acetyltransferase [Deinococcus maricopensis DSM 21211]